MTKENHFESQIMTTNYLAQAAGQLYFSKISKLTFAFLNVSLNQYVQHQLNSHSSIFLKIFHNSHLFSHDITVG